MAALGLRRPVYQQIRDSIAAEIANNVWQPGQPMPSEAELATRHGVASGTLRQALDALAAEGLIERVQGRGTFVRRPTFETGSVRSIQCLGSAGDRRRLHSRILDKSKSIGPREVTEALELPEHSEVVRLLRLCALDDNPVLIEEIWLTLPRFAPVLTAADADLDSLYPLYESLCGATVACVEETVTISTAAAPETDLLGVAVGSPLVVVHRLSLGYDNKPIEFRLSRGLTSDFRYKLVIR